jgi:hypothetical protein
LHWPEPQQTVASLQQWEGFLFGTFVHTILHDHQKMLGMLALPMRTLLINFLLSDSQRCFGSHVPGQQKNTSHFSTLGVIPPF